MFDFVHKNRRIIQVVLAIVLLPFAFFGVDSYFRDRASGQAVAKVGDFEISEQQFQQALRERQETLREMSGGRVDPSLLDSPELRMSVLDGLVRQQLLLTHAVKAGLTVTPDQLRAFITQAPAFQENGKFSMERYQQMLKGRNETAPFFENRVRQELLLTQLKDVYADSSFTPRTLAERVLRITEEKREVSRATISASDYIAAVKLEPDAVKKYYDAHPDEFRVPEQVRVEYVALSIDSLLPQVQVDAADVKRYYDEHQRDFGVPEQRQASHILITVDKNAPPDAKQKARARAEEIYNEVKKNPGSFAELAKKYSQDPGSAEKGGDLGSFSRGTMVKAFDDAVAKMKPGEISPPVESEYGFHIIKLKSITPGTVNTLDQVRPQIEQELKKQVASRQFAELAEKFNNIVFEQSDSLKPAAELVHANIQTSGWITRNSAEDAKLNNPKLLQAVFSDDVLNNKRNTEAIEVSPGTIVAARVVEHKPSSLQPFDQVKAAIEKKLVQMRATQLTSQEGRRQLEELKQGKTVQVSWSAPTLVSRAEPQGLPETVVRQVFKADASKLPAYAGVEAPGGGGYMLLRVSRIVQPDKIDPAREKAIGEGLAQLMGDEEFNAYVASLREKAKVRLVNKEKLEKATER